MIFVIRQAVENLSAAQIRKAAHDVIDGGAIDDQPDHVVYPDARSP